MYVCCYLERRWLDRYIDGTYCMKMEFKAMEGAQHHFYIHLSPFPTLRCGCGFGVLVLVLW